MHPDRILSQYPLVTASRWSLTQAVGTWSFPQRLVDLKGAQLSGFVPCEALLFFKSSRTRITTKYAADLNKQRSFLWDLMSMEKIGDILGIWSQLSEWSAFWGIGCNVVNHGKPNKNHPQYGHNGWSKPEKTIQPWSFMALDLPHCSNSGVPGTRSTIPRILRVRLRRQIGGLVGPINFPSMPW